MNTPMFCWQCQETHQNHGCTIAGHCGKRSETANEMDRLIAALKSFAIALRAHGVPPTRADGRLIIRALFLTITNVNFDSGEITKMIDEVSRAHARLCPPRVCGGSVHQNPQAPNVPSSERSGEKVAEGNGSVCDGKGDTEASQPSCAAAEESVPPTRIVPGVQQIADEDLCSLCELITYGLKGIAAYAEHAAVLGEEDDALYSFFVQTLAKLADEQKDPDFSTLAKHRRLTSLIERVHETGLMAVRAMELLDRANTQRFGNPELTTVRTGVGARPGILISGHDLLDLYELLEQTAGQGIDVYTHGEMLPAHAYPELKKYPHLVGNYGGSWFHQPEEFTAFQGPILMTTNCIVPVREAYKDRIFTTGVVGYPGVKHIADRAIGGSKDFSPIIAMAKTSPPPLPLPSPEACVQMGCTPTETLTIGAAHHQVLAIADKVVAAIRSGQIRHFVVMAGCDGRHSQRSYFTEFAYQLPQDTVILTAGCAKYRYHRLPLGDINGIPRVLDAGQCNDSYSLVRIAMALKDAFGLTDLNELPLSFEIAWYEQKAVAVLLALLALGLKKIRLGPTLPAFLSPTVLEYLVKTYEIGPTA